MSEEKRTVEIVHREYSQLCAQAGHLSYQVATLAKDLDLVHETLRSLNLEAAKLKAEESAEAAKKAE